MVLVSTVVLVLHILAVMVAVGTVTVTDYLHILGLRDRILEKRAIKLFPHLAQLIMAALILIYLTGGLMVYYKPELLSSTMFQLKLTLVLIVTANGFFLHKVLFPHIEKSVETKEQSKKLIRQAAFGGSISIVTWYSIVILAMTKNLGYSVAQFLGAYGLALVIAYFTAEYIETHKYD